MITIRRYHSISCGHRVYGHEGQCNRLHGHNYRIHFVCYASDLDDLGRIIDFSEIKKRLCEWLDYNWDHRFLIWEEDPIREQLALIDPSVVWVPFNPTAENIASHMLKISPDLLKGTGVKLIRCTVEETDKCSATATGSYIDENV